MEQKIEFSIAESGFRLVKSKATFTFTVNREDINFFTLAAKFALFKF